MVESALERRYLVAGPARAFGKNDYRMVASHLLRHPFDRDARGFLFFFAAGGTRSTVDQNSLEHLRRQITADHAFFPIVPSRDGPGIYPQILWEGGPDDDEVQMTRVIGEKDSLCIT